VRASHVILYLGQSASSAVGEATIRKARSDSGLQSTQGQKQRGRDGKQLHAHLEDFGMFYSTSVPSRLAERARVNDLKIFLCRREVLWKDGHVLMTSQMILLHQKRLS